MLYKLSDIFDLQMGKTPSRDNNMYWKDGNLPWVSIADLSKSQIYIENSKDMITNLAAKDTLMKCIPQDTVIMSFKLSLGKTAITKTPLYTNEAIMAFIDKKVIQIEPIYIYFLFRNIKWGQYTNNAVKGKTLNKKFFSDFQIYIPEYTQQTKIASILIRINKILEYKHSLIKVYDVLIKSRFDEFNKNNNNVKVSKLEALCTSIVRGPFGSALKVENFVKKSDTSVKVYEQSNAIQRSAAIGSRYISREHYESLRRFKCKPGDIIMSCSGTIGKLFILPNDAEEGIINQALCKFTLGKELLPEVFLLYMDILIGNIEIKGSGIKNISAVKFIKNLEIPVPPIGIQSKLLFELNQINKLKSDVQKSIDETQLLMDSLMQEYFG
ncbi:restriction endonuclease subunit S [Veillonella atypica]|uniref:restriction endonuclease subunit S n=1 Tax=Veillonella atypica TaxID=39777 RepID=UPI001960973B|nr:restriction endonuclease subunit S [Veillonella atypica]VTY44240.1 Type I restriction modification DNA specificity domain protein [Veillonella atypica]